MERIKLLLTLDIDPETGDTTCVNREIINDDIKKVKRTAKKKKEESTDPIIILEENKMVLNQAVVDLLELDLDEENRLGVKYEKQGKLSVPVFGSSKAFGTKADCNKLTKSLTIACRGKSHDELAKFGTEFTLEPHPTKSGLFLLKGENEVEIPEGDENIGEPKEITEDDLDLSGFIADDNETEVDGFDFNL